MDTIGKDVYKRQLLSKVYDDPKYNAAFDRCVDVMARLLQKYGPQLLGQMQETEKDEMCIRDSFRTYKAAI